MATFNPFNSFTEEVAAGSHANILNADTGTVVAYLSNATPSAADDSVKADLAEISTGNGYTGPVDMQNAATQTGSVITLTVQDQEIEASGGPVGPFQYVVFANDDTTGDMLIGWYDAGEAITLAAGEKFVIDAQSFLVRMGFGL